MAEKFRFMDPVQQEDGTYDREYNAQEFTDYFKALVTTGVMKSAGNQLVVSANGNNMITRIDTGIAVILGRYYENDSFRELTHDTESLGNSRIDRVVIRMDLSTDKRHVLSFVKKGMPSTNPVAPALTQTPNIYEISLAQVRVVGGQTFIAANAVTSERGIDVICPWAGSNIMPNFDDNALAQHINNTDIHVDAAKQQLINNSIQANRFNDNVFFNLGINYSEKSLPTIAWENDTTTERLYIMFPKTSMSGVFELIMTSTWANTNAGGGAVVRYFVTTTDNGTVPVNKMEIVSATPEFLNSFHIGEFYFAGSLFVIPISKRDRNNPLSITMRFNDTSGYAYGVLLNSSHYTEALTQVINWPIQKSYIDEKYDKLFTSVSEGKADNRSALAQKGVSVPVDPTFAQISDGILRVETGKKVDFIMLNVPSMAANGQTSVQVATLFKPMNIVVGLEGLHVKNGVVGGYQWPNRYSVYNITNSQNGNLWTVTISIYAGQFPQSQNYIPIILTT